MYGLYLIAVLVLVGGVIAYIGDQVGRFVGRRRLTLLGLRPRHTSFLITVLTGVSIVAASIATLTWLSNDVRTALFEMREIQAAYRESQEAYKTSQRQLAELRRRVEHHEEYLEEIIAARDAAAAETRELQIENARLSEALEDARHDLEMWKRQVTVLQRQSEELEDDIRKMEATRDEMQRLIGHLTSELEQLERRMRQGEFAFLRDEVVYDQVIAGGGARAEMEAALLAVLETADAIALQRGARITGKASAIELADEEAFFHAAEMLASEEVRWVVRVVAQQNTVHGEPLLVYLHLFPEREPLYRAGETIVARVLDGGHSNVEKDLFDLLQEVNRRALQAGMITQGDGSVGEIPSEEFVDALVRLRRVGGPARVSIRAAAETWITAGPLRVTIDVEEVWGQ